MEPKEDYLNKSQKIVDFCIGFFGEILGWVLIVGLLSLIKDFWSSFLATIVLIGLPLIGLGLAIYLLIKNRRRYIGIGMIIPFAVIPLVFGACFLIFSASMIFQ